MDKRLMIAFGALLVIVSAFIVTSNTDAYEAAETNDAPEVIFIDDIVENNTYWAKGTLSAGTLILSNNDSGKDAILILALKSGSTLSVDEVITTTAGTGMFTVPENSALMCGFINNIGEKVGYALNVSKILHVKGMICGAAIVSDKDVDIAFTKASVGGDDYGLSLPFYLILNNTASVKFNSNTVVHSLRIMEGYYNGISITNALLSNVSIGYKAPSSSNGNSWVLSGTFYRSVTSGMSYIDLGDESNIRNADAFTFKNVDFYSFVIYLSFKSTTGIVISDDREIIDYSDSIIVCNNSDIFKFFRSSDSVTKTMIINFSNGSIWDTDGITKIYLKVNPKSEDNKAYFGLTLNATEGISSISTPIAFVHIYETIDLTSITVKCEKGYTFAGWYYVSENGVLTKILDPSQVLVYDSVNIYALAEPDFPAGGDSKDYTMYFAGIIALIAIMLVVVAVGMFRKK